MANINTEHPHGQATPSAPVPTMNSSGKRRWLYPDRRSGAHASRRRNLAVILIIFYLIAPWLRWNGIPLLRLDVIEKKAFILGQIFQVNDATLIAPGMAAMALLLFFATSIKGRIWCAYGCPQTVFVEWIIRPIEELTEGSAHHRRSMDAGPQTLELRLRKGLKHILFLAVSALVANTFISFFVGPDRVAHWTIRPPTEHPMPFFVMTFVMLAFYADLAWFREQFCAFLCPYARFQSVMIDQHTPTVAYDAQRGDPKGQDKKVSLERKFGDCIDCQLCVRVCPTGIDIRDGLQLECIMCARCIDACDMVMTNLGRPKELIKIASQNELAGHKKTAIWQRPKTMAYAATLLLMTSAGAIRILGRDDLALTIIRAPGPVYTHMPDGRLGNMFVVRATNNTSSPIKLDLEIVSPKGAEILCAQCGTDVGAANVLRATAIVMFDKSLANKEIVIREKSTDDDASSILLGPN